MFTKLHNTTQHEFTTHSKRPKGLRSFQILSVMGLFYCKNLQAYDGLQITKAFF